MEEEKEEVVEKEENGAGSMAQGIKVFAVHTLQLKFNAQNLCNGFHKFFSDLHICTMEIQPHHSHTQNEIFLSINFPDWGNNSLHYLFRPSPNLHQRQAPPGLGFQPMVAARPLPVSPEILCSYGSSENCGECKDFMHFVQTADLNSVGLFPAGF